VKRHPLPPAWPEWLYIGPISPVPDLEAEVDGYPAALAGRVVSVELGEGGGYARITRRGRS
jgi:hypothetical protein